LPFRWWAGNGTKIFWCFDRFLKKWQGIKRKRAYNEVYFCTCICNGFDFVPSDFILNMRRC
jgi:hypothetical protein